MKSVEFDIQFAGWTARIISPFDLSISLKGFFRLALKGQSVPRMTFEISELEQGFDIVVDGAQNCPAHDFYKVIDIIQTTFLAGLPTPPAAIKVEGGAVALEDRSLLVLGPDRASVSLLVASLVDQGFRYLGQQYVILHSDGNLEGFPGPVHVPSARLPWLNRLDAFQDQLGAANADDAYVTPPSEWWVEDEKIRCGAIVLANAFGDRNLQISAATKEMLTAALRLPAERGDIHAVLEALPCLTVGFSNPKVLGDTPANLLRMLLTTSMNSEAFSRLVASISGAAVLVNAEPPERSSRSIPALMTIGMACHDDFDGVYFSIQSLRLHHPEVLDRIEFLVIDNNPSGRGAHALKGMENYIPNYRYIPFAETTSTAVRDQIFREAAGEYVLAMDCHVMFPAGAISALLDYFERNPETRNLVQGPILKNSLDGLYSHWDPVWRKHMFGTWAYDSRAEHPVAPAFDIPLQGLGVFACRRDAWPGFNPAFRGFGGEEGYIHEKFRQRGGRTLCLPALRWLHRFDRPFGVSYPLNIEDRIRNYYIGWSELGLPVDSMIEHMTEEVGENLVSPLIAGLRLEFG